MLFRFFADINVPSKQLGTYTDKENDSIFYADQIRLVRTSIEKWIVQMQERLNN